MPMNQRLLRPLARLQASQNDPHFSQVALLLHMDGANNSTTFTDSSSSPKTVSANGNAKISTDQSRFGGSSALFDGSGDYLRAQFAFNWSHDFTIEMWIRRIGTGTGAIHTIFEAGDISAGRGGLNLYVESDGDIVWNNAFSADTAGGNLPLDQWVHLAAVRRSGASQLYVGGQAVGVPGSTTYPVINNIISIGGAPNYSFWPFAYIDEFRLTQHARYTANFTPPTAPFPNQ